MVEPFCIINNTFSSYFFIFLLLYIYNIIYNTLLYDEDEVEGHVYPTCYFHIHLTKRPFWQRVKYGIQYIFGRQCNYGAFDEFIFKPKDADKLQELVNYLKELEK